MGGIPQLVVLLVLGVFASTAIGVLSASLMVLAKRAQPVLTLYGLAASLLAGAAFSVDQLPQPLQWLSYAIPHTYVINSARSVLMDDPGTFSIPFGTAVIALVVFNILVFGTGMWLFNRALQYARKMGMLSGY
jgi:ABC-2 type transport system permease protein